MKISYKKSDIRFASTLVVTWLAAVVFAFWWFQFKDLHAFNKSIAVEQKTDSHSFAESSVRLQSI